MNEKQMQFDKMFTLQWIATSAVGLILGGMLAFGSVWGVGGLVENALGETAAIIVVGGLFGAFLGLSANIGPGLLLARQGVPAGRWITASILAGTVGMAFAMSVMFLFFDMEAPSEVLQGALLGLAMGLPSGLAQWLVLRRQGVSASGWPAVSVTAFTIGMTLGLPLGGEGREWLSLAAIGLLVGAITGLGMAWSLRRQTALAV